MSVILEAKTKLLNLIANIEEIIRLEAIEHQDFIAELNQMQLAEGQRPDGSFLPDYSQTSVSVFGKPPGAIKLFDEGDFYEGIKPLFESQGLDMVGLDEKTSMLINRYGDVLGLSQENKQRLAVQLLPGIKVRIKKHLL